MSKNLRIELIRKDILAPSEVINGFVSYTVFKNTHLKAIRVQFKGYEHSSWSETPPTNATSADSKSRTGKFYQAKDRKLFKQDITLWGNANESSKDKHPMKADDYRWDFSFIIPPDVPSSCTHRNGRVRIVYRLKAKVEKCFGSFDSKTFQFVHIAQRFVVDPSTPLFWLSSEKSWLLSDETVRLEGSLSSYVVQSGESVRINIVINNGGSMRSIYGLKIKLKQNWEYGKEKEKTTVGKGESIEGFPIQKGRHERPIVFTIPPLPFSPTITNAALVRLTYHISIHCMVKVGSRPKLHLPIVISSLPPLTLAGNRPPKPLPAPPTVNVIPTTAVSLPTNPLFSSNNPFLSSSNPNQNPFLTSSSSSSTNPFLTSSVSNQNPFLPSSTTTNSNPFLQSSTSSTTTRSSTPPPIAQVSPTDHRLSLSNSPKTSLPSPTVTPITNNSSLGFPSSYIKNASAPPLSPSNSTSSLTPPQFDPNNVIASANGNGTTISNVLYPNLASLSVTNPDTSGVPIHLHFNLYPTLPSSVINTTQPPQPTAVVSDSISNHLVQSSLEELNATTMELNHLEAISASGQLSDFVELPPDQTLSTCQQNVITSAELTSRSSRQFQLAAQSHQTTGPNNIGEAAKDMSKNVRELATNATFAGVLIEKPQVQELVLNATKIVSMAASQMVIAGTQVKEEGEAGMASAAKFLDRGLVSLTTATQQQSVSPTPSTESIASAPPVQLESVRDAKKCLSDALTVLHQILSNIQTQLSSGVQNQKVAVKSPSPNNSGESVPSPNALRKSTETDPIASTGNTISISTESNPGAVKEESWAGKLSVLGWFQVVVLSLSHLLSFVLRDLYDVINNPQSGPSMSIGIAVHSQEIANCASQLAQNIFSIPPETGKVSELELTEKAKTLARNTAHFVRVCRVGISPNSPHQPLLSGHAKSTANSISRFVTHISFVSQEQDIVEYEESLRAAEGSKEKPSPDFHSMAVLMNLENILKRSDLVQDNQQSTSQSSSTLLQTQSIPHPQIQIEQTQTTQTTSPTQSNLSTLQTEKAFKPISPRLGSSLQFPQAPLPPIPPKPSSVQVPQTSLQTTTTSTTTSTTPQVSQSSPSEKTRPVSQAIPPRPQTPLPPIPPQPTKVLNNSNSRQNLRKSLPSIPGQKEKEKQLEMAAV